MLPFLPSDWEDIDLQIQWRDDRCNGLATVAVPISLNRHRFIVGLLAVNYLAYDAIVDRPQLDVRLGEETGLAHVDSLGYPHCLINGVPFILASCLVFPNMLRLRPP